MADAALHIAEDRIGISISESDGLHVAFGGQVFASNVPDYEGPYEVTPSEEIQVLHEENMRALHDIVINPIPNNYGLVTRVGSNLIIT